MSALSKAVDALDQLTNAIRNVLIDTEVHSDGHISNEDYTLFADNVARFLIEEQYVTEIPEEDE